MRLNKYLALSAELSRRASDKAIQEGRVLVNNSPAVLGQEISEDDEVKLDNQIIMPKDNLTLVLNKPTGYVCSRNGQGSPTVYELLPKKYHHLQTVGRLDKDSSGLLLMTNDGNLANELTHPRYSKEKIYQVKLNKPLGLADKKELLTGIKLDDGLSKFITLDKSSDNIYKVVLAEGRNRQIRRTFAALGYNVQDLHRIQIGNYLLDKLEPGQYRLITNTQ